MSFKPLLCFLIFLETTFAGPGMKTTVYTTLPSSGSNAYYAGNRAPLKALPLIKLPAGAVKPDGWLKTQLELMTEGFPGRLTEISKWCRYDSSAWVSPTGEGKYPWEELPYWLRGFVALGYASGNQRIISESKRWIEGVLSSQDSAGYFGPRVNWTKHDIWPNMVMLYALRTHYEATGDRRIIPFMTRYFRWMASVPEEYLLPESWQKIRGGDNLDNIHWLFNQTGELWLLDLARRNHERTSDWTNGIPSWHGVNICECFREPAQFYQQSGDPRHLAATERNYDTVMALYGEVPGGMFGADENARPGYGGPRQGAESCSMVEIMNSHEMLTRITGSTKWADRCEDVAFNSLPAAFTPDWKGLHYLTAPNMVQLDSANKAPMIENDGDMLTYNPHRYRCCQHNVAFGWPYFNDNLWMATPGNGLAAVLYAPSRVKANVGDGTEITITESTSYPFEETITLRVSTDRSVSFPLTLRIPSWTEGPSVMVNGEAASKQLKPGSWLVIERTWKHGDEVHINFPAHIRVRTWAGQGNALSIHRGPLAYSVEIGERWERFAGTDRWPAYQVFPTTPWNYGFRGLDRLARSITVASQRALKAGEQPFSVQDIPVRLRTRAERIGTWRLEANGFVGELPPTFEAGGPVEEITLIPMGAARLRISVFPLVE